jgi:integrase
MKQGGYVYRKGNAWYLRYRDTVIEKGKPVRKQYAKRIATVAPEHLRLRNPPASVLELAEIELRPVNDAAFLPEHNVTLGEFVDGVYFPNMVGHKRESTLKGYRARWDSQLAARCGGIRLREFSTPHAQRILAAIGSDQPDLRRSTLHHLRSLLSGMFRHAIQQGYITGANPIREASIPNAPEGDETYAYSLHEELAMLRLFPEPARSIVGVAAFTGLGRSEIRGQMWEHYTGDALKVTRSVWESFVNEPKTRKRKAPVPVILPLRRLLDQYRLSVGSPTAGVMFATMKGTPLSLNNVLNRQILPVLNACVHCGDMPAVHDANHRYERDPARPMWHGWHAFRRGLATNLHDLGVNDKTTQAILRHANVAVTQAAYIKTLPAQSIAAMQQLEDLVAGKLLLVGDQAICAPVVHPSSRQIVGKQLEINKMGA